MSDAALRDKHLAELFELAAEAGIDRYRLLSREELLVRLGDEGADAEPDNGERARDREEPRDREEQGVPVSGVLDITPRGHGFIRLEEANEDDVYVSPSQIRRCELQRGDLVSGPARGPRRGERHPALVHIDTVNGVEPGGDRREFTELEPVPATRRLPLSGEQADAEQAVLLRSVDLLAPLARGQRVLVRAQPRSGRTTLLRALAAELTTLDDLEVIVVLVDERPEESGPWAEAVPDAEISAATAEMRPTEQLRVVELAIAQAKRRAEGGADVVLIVDSLSRLAVAADDPGIVKPIFGAGRETAEEGAGSLTVIATVLRDAGGDGVDRVLETTENATITLSAELASVGIFPALEVGGCGVTAENSLRDERELAGARALRAELAGLPARDAAERLRERLAAVPANSSLLESLA
jgi:transcription termination factor Rho